MSWLEDYAVGGATTDALTGRADHRELLAAGLFGEAGSVAAEVKKMAREGPAYPAYKKRLTEEVGDFLWYLVRLATVFDVTLEPISADSKSPRPNAIVSDALLLGASVAPILEANFGSAEADDSLQACWSTLRSIALDSSIDLEQAARANLAKIRSRWPATRTPHPLFDDDDIADDQLPRSLSIEFRELGDTVGLRYRQVGIGDRITDNIESPDAYRYHDVFHMAYVAFLGWSPVIRSLLKCKRKSTLEVDRDQDGARAAILEEAIAATVFSRAKEMGYFETAKSIDYDLLKMIQEFTTGYEVEGVPLWQWEEAILEGFRVFRLLRDSGPGIVSWDMKRRELSYEKRN